MATIFGEQKITPDELEAELQKELSGRKPIEGNGFGNNIKQPTELDPLDIDTSLEDRQKFSKISLDGIDTGPKVKLGITSIKKELKPYSRPMASPEGVAAFKTELGGLYTSTRDNPPTAEEDLDARKLMVHMLDKPYVSVNRPYNQKVKLGNARNFLNKIALVDKTRSSLKSLAEFGLRVGEDVSEIVETIAEAQRNHLLYPDEVKNLEIILDIPLGGESTDNSTKAHEPLITLTQEPESSTELSVGDFSTPKETHIVESEPVKPEPVVTIPTVDQIPREKPTINIVLEKTYPPKEVFSPTAEKIVREMPLGQDNRFAAEAKRLYETGDIGDALVFVAKIQDEYERDTVVHDIVVDCVGKGDFAMARRFVDKIKDETYQDRLLVWVNGHVKVEMPDVLTNYGDSVPNKQETSYLKTDVVAESMPVSTTPESVKPQEDGSEKIAGIKVKRLSSVEPVPIVEEKNTDQKDLEPKIVIPEGFYSKHSSVTYPEKKVEDTLSTKTDLDDKQPMELRDEFDTTIRELRSQIKEAEKSRDEAKVLNLEGQLRTVERQKIQIGKTFEVSGTDLDRKIKEQVQKVKLVENTDEKSYMEELAKLRVLERERDSLRAPKTEKIVMPTAEKVPEVKKEIIEDPVATLDKARDEYASVYVDWELKSRKGKKLFLRTLLDLGASRPTPARLSSKTPAMEEAKAEYLRAIKSNHIDVEKDAQKLLLSEKLLLENRLQELRVEKSQKSGDPEMIKEVNLLDKALNTWTKSTTRQKAITGALILGGGMMLSTVGDEGKEFYQGLRVDRSVSSDAGNIPEVSKPKVGLPTIETLPEIKIPENIPPVGIVNSEITSVSLKRAESVAPKQLEPMSSGPVIPESEVAVGQVTQIIDEPIIPVGDSEPEKIAEVPISSDAEKSGLKNHIPYKNSFVGVVDLDNKTGRAVVYNGIEIGHERDFHGGKIFSLDDQYEKGGQFIEIRGAFKAFLDQNLSKDLILTNPVEFEGGVVHIVKDPSSNEKILALLNGNEVGSALITKKKVKFEVYENLKGGWFLADNVYEKACKVATAEIQAINKSSNAGSK